MNIKDFLLQVGKKNLIEKNVLIKPKLSLESDKSTLPLIRLMREYSIDILDFDDKWCLKSNLEYLNKLGNVNEFKNITEGDIFLNTNENFNPFFCEVYDFLVSFSREELINKKVINSSGSLEDENVLNLIKLMKDNDITILKQSFHNNMKWYLKTNCEFLNSYSGCDKPGTIADGKIFLNANEYINPHSIVEPPSPPQNGIEVDIFEFLSSKTCKELGPILNTVRKLLNGQSLRPLKDYMKNNKIRKFYYTFTDYSCYGKEWYIITKDWVNYEYINQRASVHTERPALSGDTFKETNDFMNPHSSFYKGDKPHNCNSSLRY